MADHSRKPKLSLRALVDKEKNKIVLVEACKDFVDVLFSFLKLQMGTIVRLVNKQSQQTAVGCFSNIYRSVLDMDIDNFPSEACKTMLLYPRSLEDDLFRRLKVNVNETTEECKFFICPGYNNKTLCSQMWASFNTSKCSCGKKMEMKIEVGNASKLGNDVDGVFVRGKPSFIITDDMTVQSNSTYVFLQVVKDQGYVDVDKLSESLLVIGSEEVLTLLECLFSSNTPLTDAFLRKQSSHNMNVLNKPLSPALQEYKNDADSGCLTLNVVVRKKDRKVLYFECREDFVNLLFTFLAVSLEFGVEASGDNMVMGCILNLFRSFNDLRFDKRSRPKANSTLPWYYGCQKNLLDITTVTAPDFGFSSDESRLMHRYGSSRMLGFRDYNPVNHLCPHSVQSIRLHCNACKGFVKENMKFRVTDDLIITPLSSSSTIGYLKQFQVNLADVDVQEISIGKVEV
ncbi:hypothetical protein N665_0068s0015 [Sinapis alba]|nr:hypothetical protein N665_0068s0015 [Sinapis alba]